MAIKGGYQIIDLQRKPLYSGGNSETIPDIFNLIIGTNKPYLITGIVINDTEYDDEFVSIEIDGSECVFRLHNFVVSVESDNSVSVR